MVAYEFKIYNYLLNNYKFFFFDFDGVIVDSLDIKAQAFGELFKDYGEDIVRKVVDYHLDNEGVSRYEKFKYYYKNILNREITHGTIEDLDKKYSHIVVEKVVKAPFIKGVMDFVKKLNGSRKECFLISATPQEEIRSITKLKRIDKFFKEIVGSPRRKSENLRYLLNKFNIKNNESIYFGDAKSDYEAARENNIDFIRVVNRRSKELKEFHDVPKIKDFNF